MEGCEPVVLIAGRVVLPWLEPARLEPASLPEMLTWRCWPAGRVICMSRRRMPFWDGGLGERRARLPRLECSDALLLPLLPWLDGCCPLGAVLSALVLCGLAWLVLDCLGCLDVPACCGSAV